MITKPIIQRPNMGEEVKEIQRLLHLHVDGKFGALTQEVVRTFQSEQGLYPDGIVGPKTWEALLKQGEEEQTDDFIKFYKGALTQSRRRIDYIAIHCTATPEGRDMTVEQIRRIHMRDNGWSDIGYHYVIYRDGTIHGGRPVDIVGAHVSGYNSHSIGVVYVGGVAADGKTPKDTRTDEQKRSMLALLQRLSKLYPKAKVMGHREFSPDKNGNGIIEPQEWIKACPSFEVLELRSELRKIKAYK